MTYREDWEIEQDAIFSLYVAGLLDEIDDMVADVIHEADDMVDLPDLDMPEWDHPYWDTVRENIERERTEQRQMWGERYQ